MNSAGSSGSIQILRMELALMAKSENKSEDFRIAENVIRQAFCIICASGSPVNENGMPQMWGYQFPCDYEMLTRPFFSMIASENKKRTRKQNKRGNTGRGITKRSHA